MNIPVKKFITYLGMAVLVSLLSPATVMAKNEKVVICHIPPEDPENAYIMEIDESALQGHVDHGDTLGACPSLDSDADGIPDSSDQCPFEPETFNNFLDEDGCPDWIPNDPDSELG